MRLERSRRGRSCRLPDLCAGWSEITMSEIQQPRVIHTILHEELVAAYTVSQSVMDGVLYETGTAQTHDMVTEVPGDHLVESLGKLCGEGGGDLRRQIGAYASLSRSKSVNGSYGASKAIVPDSTPSAVFYHPSSTWRRIARRSSSTTTVSRIQKHEHATTYVFVELITSPVKAQNQCPRRGRIRRACRLYRRNAGRHRA